MERLERRVTRLEELPARMDALTLQVLQLREEMRGEFSAVREETRGTRAEMRALNEDARAEMHAMNERTLAQMRILHEELVGRIAVMRNGGEKPPKRRRKA